MTVPSDQVLTYRAIMQAITSGPVELTGQRSLLKTFAKVFAPPGGNDVRPDA
jgi:hypothetical protein